MKLFISIWTATKFNIFCLSIILFSSLKSFACGPSFNGFYFTWLMEAYQPNSKFYDYQLDLNSPFYSKSWYQDEVFLFNPKQENINAWRKHLNLSNSFADTTIQNFIYYNNSTSIQSLKNKKTSSNKIENEILNNKNKNDLLSYFIYINTLSEHYLPKTDVWNYDSYTSFTSLDSVKKFINEGEILFNKTTSDFLQTRILYAQLRASHFNKHYALTIKTFEKNFPKLKNKNTLEQFWCEGLYAGALQKINENEKAIYYFSRAFSHCPDLAYQYMNSYVQGNQNWQGALAYCNSSQDTVSVILMAGASHTLPTMDFIKTTYKSQPNSETLKLLWLREASKLDEFIFSNTTEFFSNKTHEYISVDNIYKNNTLVNDFETFGLQILNNQENILAKVSVGNSLAYYFYKLKNYKKARECLTKIENLSKDNIEKLQYDLLDNLIHLKNTNQFNELAFKKLLIQFSKIPNGSMNKNIGYYLIYNEIAPYYLNQNNDVTAFWAYTFANCFNNDKFYLYSTDYSPESWNSVNMATYLLNHKFDVTKIDELRNAFKAQKGNSDFETYLIQGIKMEDGDALFNLVKSRKYMLQQNWQAALDVLPNVDTSFKNIMGTNPANFNVNDYFDEAEINKNLFSIRSILELAKSLKEKSDGKNLDNAKDQLLYGTILYNLSFYGKNHYVIDNHWNHYGSRQTPYFLFNTVTANYFYNDEQKYNLPMSPLYQNYFYLYDAEKYLLKALSGLKNKEEKAQCVFLLAKCWQKRCPIDLIKDDNFYLENFNIYYKNSLKNPYFAMLWKDYKNTKNQELYFKSCSYYTRFANKQ